MDDLEMMIALELDSIPFEELFGNQGAEKRAMTARDMYATLKTSTIKGAIEALAQVHKTFDQNLASRGLKRRDVGINVHFQKE